MADLTLTCPHCGEGIVLPAAVIHTDPKAHTALVRIDRTAAEVHLAECREKAREASTALVAVPTPAAAELAGRVGQMLAMRAYVATGGSRACTLCGMNGQDCLEQLGKPGEGIPCCAGCGNGNTHPAPGEAKGTCAQWSADHHGADS